MSGHRSYCATPSALLRGPAKPGLAVLLPLLGALGCASGSATPDGDGSSAPPDAPPACIPVDEVCDGVDNDCDDSTDEGCACAVGATQPCGSDVGECSPGTQTCTDGVWGACTGQVGPATETCNSLDDDCNGTADNGDNGCGGACALPGAPGAPCDGADADQCGDDTYACAGINAVACSAGADNVETFNMADDDCDGTTDEGFSVLALFRDDYTGTTGTCPAGYSPRGRFKVDTVPLSPPANSGGSWDGYALYSGWLQLCSPTADVILARGWDDHAGTGGGCPSGYNDRGAFKVDGHPATGTATGVAYDGYVLRSGWLHLCTTTGRETLVVGLDDLTGFSEPCPNGTSERGAWKPDVVPPGGPSSVSTAGYAMTSGWLRYCVAN